MSLFGFEKPHDEAATLDEQATAPASAPAPAPAASPGISPAASPGPAPTNALPDGGFKIEDITAWLQSLGCAAKIVEDPNGKHHVESTILDTPFNIFLADMKDDRAASLEFGAAFSTHGKFDTTLLNEWNCNERWCRAYFDDVKDPWLEMDFDLSPGGTYEMLNDQFKIWNNMLGKFIDKYGLR